MATTNCSSSLNYSLFFISLLVSVIFAALPVESNTAIRVNSPGTGRLDLELPEELPVGTVVVNDVMRESGTSGSASVERMQFDVVSGTLFRDHFRVDAATGNLIVSQVIDREYVCSGRAVCRGNLDIAAASKASGSDSGHFRFIRVNIILIDVNDNDPTFHVDSTAVSASGSASGKSQLGLLVLEVSESASPGTSLALPAVDDPDSGRNGRLNFRYETNCSKQLEFRSPNDNQRTDDELDQTDDVTEGVGPALIITERLDREVQPLCAVTLTVLDGGSPPKSTSLEVLVRVLDANDNSPTFERLVYNVTVSEDLAPGSTVIQVNATDPDEGLNGDIRYSFSRQTLIVHGSKFAIDAVSGRVTLRRPLDSNEAPYSLIVTAVDRGQSPVPTLARVHVAVLDVNNHAPSIRLHHHQSAVTGRVAGRRPETENARLEVSENRPAGSFVGHVTVDDPDSGDGGRVDCELIDGSDLFEMSPIQMMTSSSSSGEDVSAATGSDGPASSSTVFVLKTKLPLDREARSEHAATIACRDRGRLPVGPLSSEVPFAVRVTDENDNAPLFVQSTYSVNIRENGTASQGHPMPILRVRATDLDERNNSLVSYRLAVDDEGSNNDGGNNAEAARYVTIDPRTGMISATSSFDYERTKRIVFSVVAVDNGQPVALSSSVGVIVVVIDINDERPEFVQQSYSFGTFENQPSRTEIGSVEATDRDGAPFNRFVYSLRGGNGNGSGNDNSFAIDSDTGTIVALRPLDRETVSEHRLVAVATELAHPHGTATVDVTIHVADRNDNAPVIVYPSPQNRTVELSVFSSAGHVFAHVIARDADVGVNARLRFSIVDDVEDSGGELFDVDPNAGTLSIRDDGRLAALPSHVTGAVVRVVVRDCGDPELAGVAEFDVVFNRSEEAAALSRRKMINAENDGYGDARRRSDDANFLVTLKPSSGLLWFQHREWLIVLAAGTLLTMIVLIAAIICVRRRQLSAAGDERSRSRRSSKNSAMASTIVPLTGDKFISETPEVYLISSDNGHHHQRNGHAQRPRSRPEPELHIVRNVVGSSNCDSPWKTMQSTLPPGAKVADHGTIRYGTCGGKVSSAWTADVTECLLPQEQSTLFTFSKHSPTTPRSPFLVESGGCPPAGLSGFESRPRYTTGCDTIGRGRSRPAGDGIGVLDTPSKIPPQVTGTYRHQSPSKTVRLPVDTRQTEINELLDMLKRDTEINRQQYQQQLHQLRQLRRYDDDGDFVDDAVGNFNADNDDKYIDKDDVDCDSIDDNTSVGLADSGLGASSET